MMACWSDSLGMGWDNISYPQVETRTMWVQNSKLQYEKGSVELVLWYIIYYKYM